jgi:hypothetical protein
MNCGQQSTTVSSTSSIQWALNPFLSRMGFPASVCTLDESNRRVFGLSCSPNWRISDESKFGANRRTPGHWSTHRTRRQGARRLLNGAHRRVLVAFCRIILRYQQRIAGYPNPTFPAVFDRYDRRPKLRFDVTGDMSSYELREGSLDTSLRIKASSVKKAKSLNSGLSYRQSLEKAHRQPGSIDRRSLVENMYGAKHLIRQKQA